MKKILVSQRVDLYVDRNETRDALDQRLPLLLAECKLQAIPVPNLLVFGKLKSETLKEWIKSMDADGIILSGGNDIDSCPERDTTESILLDWAAKEKKPLLGICRGMQMMGVSAGAGLVSVDGHVRAHHILKGEITGQVNSFHNQILDDCPEGYRITARSEDDGIEAIVHERLPWEGWMWHPEREDPFSKRDVELIKKRFNE